MAQTINKTVKSEEEIDLMKRGLEGLKLEWTQKKLLAISSYVDSLTGVFHIDFRLKKEGE